jgi:hypothetical protein
MATLAPELLFTVEDLVSSAVLPGLEMQVKELIQP